MSYEVFKQKIECLAKKSGVRVVFDHDTYRGRFIARCSDGTTIIGNPDCLKITVNFGSGHCSMATI